MKNILVISLLLICTTSFGQRFIKDNGQYVVQYGSFFKSQTADIPVIPDIPTPEPDDDDTIRIVILSNSIGATTYDSITIENPTIKIVANLAVPGDRIQDQEVEWDNYVDTVSASDLANVNAVCVPPLGVNNVAENGSYESQIIGYYDDLFTNVHADISADAKIILSDMTPAKGSANVDDTESDMLKSINSNYIHSIPTYVDHYLPFFENMTDGYDSLHPWVRREDYIHPNWYGKRILRNILADTLLSVFGGPYEYADPDSVEIIKVINFDNYSAVEDPLITYLESGMEYGGYIGGDTGTYADNIALVDLDGEGDIVLRSDAKEGWCCAESVYSSVDVDSAGTGVIWVENLNASGTPRDTLLETTIAWFPADYELGDGMKFNGVQSLSDGDRDSRIAFNMIKTDGGANSFYYLFYDYGFDNASDIDISAKPSIGASSGYGDYYDSIPRGQWVAITTLHYSGTTDSYNNMRGLWINDTCVNYRSGVMQQNSADGFYAFDQVNIETHLGGAHRSYNSPKDQSFYIYSVTIWKPKNGYSMFDDLTSAPDYQHVLKLPEETGWPVTIEPPANNDWEDSIVYNIHYWEDFEDFSTTSTVDATYPVGVPEDSLAAHLDNFYDLQSDDANDPDLADNIDIIDMQGSRVMVHWYPEGMCCTGATSDINANGTNDNTGTGVHIECTMDNTSGLTKIQFGWNEFRPDTFELSTGMKNTGVRNQFSDGYASTAMARTMTVDSQNEFDMQLYLNGYFSGFDQPMERDQNTKSMSPEPWSPSGEWVNHSFIVLIGTANGSDGAMEAFVNGVKPDPTVWPPASRSGIPFIATGDSPEWTVYTYETFMGGDYEIYISVKTEYRLTDDHYAISYPDDDDLGYPHSAGESIYLPTIANYPKRD